MQLDPRIGRDSRWKAHGECDLRCRQGCDFMGCVVKSRLANVYGWPKTLPYDGK